MTPGIRNLVIAGGLATVVVGAGTTAWLFAGRDARGPAASKVTALPQTQPSLPGVKERPDLAKLLDEHEADQAAQAKATGSSTIARIRALDPNPPPTPSGAAYRPPPRPAERDDRAAERAAEAHKKAVAGKAKALADLMAGWKPHLATLHEAPLLPKDEAADEQPGTDVGRDDEAPTLRAGVAIRLGDLAYAMMRSHVNSDETMPPIAEIVSGPLQGARLSGQFERREDKLVLAFNRLDFQGAVTPIAAFAVDPDSYRQGLASEVNHRTFSRWAALLGSSFLEGVQRAYFGSGSAFLSGGGVVVSRREFADDEIARIAAGEVGRRTRRAAQDYFNRAPTVQVAAGAEVGILFLESATIPLARGAALAPQHRPR